MQGNAPRRPTLAELQCLKILSLHDSGRESQPLSNKVLAKRLNTSPQAVCNRKKALRDMGLLSRLPEGEWMVTARGRMYLTTRGLDHHAKVVESAELAILGEVRAGPAERDGVMVFLRDGDDDPPEMVTIPNTRADRDVFMLRVVGQSMEHEHIKEGDLVIVERFRVGEMPRHGDLVATRYLDISDEPSDTSLGYFGHDSVPDEGYRGPTLKYFFRQEDSWRLSWRKDSQSSPYTIITRAVRPIGRVVAVYRTI